MFQIIHLIIRLLAFLILIRCILSWIPSVRRQAREVSNAVDAVTDPILKPFQLLLPARSTGGVDFSPILAIFVLQLVEQLIRQMLW
jgi:YggT family protein